MSVPLSPTRLFVCDGCQATLPYDPALVGKKCRCGRCGKILTMPSPSAKPAPVPPRQFSFPCRLCETRMVATVELVGKKVRCPDCGVITRIPKAPPEKKKRIPDAMHGQQYGVWGVDESPSPAELAAMQPKFFPVYCRVCDTLMHALPHQIGKELSCPDCRAKTFVAEPTPEKKKIAESLLDVEEYQIDETAAPPPRPVPSSLARHDDKKRKNYRDVLQEEYGERAKMPFFPLLQGVPSMLWRRPVPMWWLILSVSSIGMAGLLSMANNLSVFAVISLTLAAIVGGFYFAALSTICCCILTESSEGNTRLYNPPSFQFADWFAEAVYLAMALSSSLVPGWAIGSIFAKPVLGLGIGFFLCFPMALLSALEVGHPLAICSGKMLASLFQRPGRWLLFYLITGLQLSATAFVCMQLQEGSEYGWLLTIPLLVASVFLYFRLLGRFAWWLAESLPSNRPGQE